MKWNKLKKLVEALLADSLQGRISYHLTRYGSGESYIMNRGWITLDKREIFSSSTIKWANEYHKLSGDPGWPPEESWEQLSQQGIFTRDDYVFAFEEYTWLLETETLQSSDPIIKAIAMFDRRVGKRRLREIKFSVNDHQIVKDFYCLRCLAEGLTPQVGIE